MWSVLNGTIVNAVAVAAGSAAGLGLSSRIPARMQRLVLDALGLVTIGIGIDAAVLKFDQAVRAYGDPAVKTYGARLAMVAVASLIVGCILGSLLRLHERIEGLGRWIHGRFGGAATPAVSPSPERVARLTDSATVVSPAAPVDARARFAEGFLSASVIFCVGPLTLLGCLNNGADNDPSLLYVKSCLDAFCSLALAATLGIGVACSIATILVFQGGLAVGAWLLAGGIPGVSISLMNVVGGYLLLATALMILEIKKIPVADMLPAIALPPAAVWLIESLAPGTVIL